MKIALASLAVATAFFAAQSWVSDDPGPAQSKSNAAKSDAATASTDDAAAAGLVKLSKTNDVWLDPKRKAVVVDGEVCLREGQLEMFACPKKTKEHESIIALNCKSEEVHAGLLAAGAKPGSPVAFLPDYKPATGQIVDIYVLWKDDKGEKQQARAQDWVKDRKTEKAMTYDWVFAGSGFAQDDEGKQYYRANGGDLVCVSNFPTATLDLPVQSSDSNDNLQFVPFTERVPARGTKVRVVFIPRKEAQAAD